MAQTKRSAEGHRPKTGMIRARIDPDLKARAESILGELGLNASDSIRLFYTQVALSDGLPFDVRIPNAETRKAIREARAGRGLNHYGSASEMFEEMGL
jgi:DNA-damage-inducible protein J